MLVLGTNMNQIKVYAKNGKKFPHFSKLEAGLIYIKSTLLSDSLDFKKAKKKVK